MDHIQLDLYNDTDSPINMIFDVTRQSEILRDPTNWMVAMSRFFIPSDTITPYKDNNATLFDDSEKDFRIGCFAKYGAGLDNQFKYYSLYPTTDVKNRSHIDFQTNLNLQLHRAYRNLFWEELNAGGNNSLVESYTNNVVHSFTQAAKTKTFSLGGGTYTNPTLCSGIKIHLTKYDSTGSYPKDSRFYLTNPNGVTCEIFIGKKLDLVAGSSLTISDSEIKDPQTELDNSTTAQYIRPVEPFAKLYKDSTPTGGNWIFTLDSENSTFNVDVELDIEIMVMNPSNPTLLQTPIYAPYFFVDETNNDLMGYRYSQTYASNIQTIISPNLADAIKFPITDTLSIDGKTWVAIETGQILYDTPPDPDNKNTLYQHLPSTKTTGTGTDLYKLVFKTTMGVREELVASSTREISKRLTDFIIPAYDAEYYSYEPDNIHRFYEFTQQEPLTSFQISVWVERIDGSESLVQLSPKKRCNLQLMLKKSSLVG